MLTYHLDPHSKTPLYEQLYRAVRADIMSGTLAGGARLPSSSSIPGASRRSYFFSVTRTFMVPETS